MATTSKRGSRALARGLAVVAAGAMCALAGALAAGKTAAAQPGASEGARVAGPVLVWPRDPHTDVAAAELALAEAGRPLVQFAPVGARLGALGQAAQAREAAALEAVEAALARARQAYLDQRFDDMIAALAQAEQDSLAVLAQPRHAGVLWELSFQLGLGFHARAAGADGGPGGGPDPISDARPDRGAADRARATERFRLALALDPDRRPLRELYGPDVSAAFAEVLSADAAVPPRPVRLEVTPADAVVVVDGVPIVAGSRARGSHATAAAGPVRAGNLRPGLHVVRAAAPGYQTRAALVTVDESGALRLALRERVDGDPVDRIGASWSQGALTPATASGQRAIAAVAWAAGAGLVVVVDAAPGQERVTARVVSAMRVGPPARADTPAEAVLAALARWEGVAPGQTPGHGQAQEPPWWRRWWVWAGVAGAVAAGAILTAVIVRDDRERWQIYVPPP